MCTGNICRSPMAEAVFVNLAEEVLDPDGTPLARALSVSSAGTGAWHTGEPMDERARAALARRGYADRGHRAQPFSIQWFDALDLVVCLDRGHRQTLAGLARARAGDDRHEPRLVLLRSFDRRSGADLEVPDPFYGIEADFDACLDLIEAGCRGLVAHLAGGVPRLLSGGTRAAHNGPSAQPKVMNDSFS
ncbi:MAG: low molecular weight protein-tyrosine-phosphatase [Acidimicrobiales bacterium]